MLIGDNMKRFVFVIVIFVALSFFYDSPVHMKDFVGQNYILAKEFLYENNIKYEVTYVYDESIEGTIISQSVIEGEKLDANDVVIIEVSNGEDMIEKYKKIGVNELGRIPVMMYHGIYDMSDDETDYLGGNVDSHGYHRTVESFKKDLNFFYSNGYRMIRLDDYVNFNIDVELGKSPIILTFDDGLKNNVNVLGYDDDGEIIIDPNSAVGVMESFKEKYPDFNVTATFFINQPIFNQSKYNDDIIKWLLNNGYDIGNHTYSHANLASINGDEVIYEIGRMYKLLDDMTNGKNVNIVSLPFGSPTSREHENFEYILKGEYNGYEYTTSSTLRVGWESDLSPFHKNFDNSFVKRIRAYDNDGLDFDIEHNFKILEKSKYVSSGQNDFIVVPNNLKGSISKDFVDKVLTY